MKNSSNSVRKLILCSLGASFLALAGVFLYGANPNPIKITIGGSAGQYTASNSSPTLSVGNHDSVVWVNSTADDTDVLVCGYGDATPDGRAFLSTQFYVPHSNPHRAPTGPVRTKATLGSHNYSVYPAADDCPQQVTSTDRAVTGPKIIIVQVTK
ncbi:MAG: hypothetical protein ACLQVL_02460 [Terriglobia bacterium]